jgi:hypothetical protein
VPAADGLSVNAHYLSSLICQRFHGVVFSFPCLDLSRVIGESLSHFPCGAATLHRVLHY